PLRAHLNDRNAMAPLDLDARGCQRRLEQRKIAVRRDRMRNDVEQVARGARGAVDDELREVGGIGDERPWLAAKINTRYRWQGEEIIRPVGVVTVERNIIAAGAYVFPQPRGDLAESPTPAAGAQTCSIVADTGQPGGIQALAARIVEPRRMRMLAQAAEHV